MRANGSIAEIHRVSVASRPGTARSKHPSGECAPHRELGDQRSRRHRVPSVRVCTGPIRTSSNVYVAATNSATSGDGAGNSRCPDR